MRVDMISITASLLGAVQVLKAQEAHLQGKVRFIFQPAEESNQRSTRIDCRRRA